MRAGKKVTERIAEQVTGAVGELGTVRENVAEGTKRLIRTGTEDARAARKNLSQTGFKAAEVDFGQLGSFVKSSYLSTLKTLKDNTLGLSTQLGASVLIGGAVGATGDRDGRVGRTLAGAATGGAYGAVLLRAGKGNLLRGFGSAFGANRGNSANLARSMTFGMAGMGAFGFATGGNVGSAMTWGAVGGIAAFGYRADKAGFRSFYKNQVRHHGGGRRGLTAEARAATRTPQGRKAFQTRVGKQWADTRNKRVNAFLGKGYNMFGGF